MLYPTELRALTKENKQIQSSAIDFLILVFDTAGMKGKKADQESLWTTTQYANLIRYNPSGKYYARIRVSGKLIVKSLKTTSISVAKLRLSDLEKSERQKAEHQIEATDGKLTFGHSQSSGPKAAAKKLRVKSLVPACRIN